MHAAYVSIQALRVALKESMFASDDFFLTTEATRHVCQVLLGYIMSDLVVAVYYGSRWSGWIANLFHHLLVVPTWSMVLSGGNAHFFAICATLAEATTPFINGRWFLDKMGMKSSTIYIVNGIIIFLGWTALRVLMIMWMVWRLYAMRD